MKSKNIPYPYSFYFWQTAGYAFIGLLTSLYLAYTHYKNHTDITFSSFCAVTQGINCDTVAQSTWSVFGGLPIAIWGIFAYGLFIILLIPLRYINERNSNGWSLVTVLALLASVCSIYLAVISATRIHSWCILCILTYTVNFLLTFSSWIIFRRFSPTKFFSALPVAVKTLPHTLAIKRGIPLLILLALIARVSMPTYWQQEITVTNVKVATGLTKEGFPWIGAANPKIVIEEFTDYQCFQCRKMHFFLRQLINQHPERIRLVHRHYPLDHEFNTVLAPDPFHVGSGKMALIAIVASKQGFFWEINDALYQLAQSKKTSLEIDRFAQLMRISTEQLATEMFTANTLTHLQHDIVQGMQHGILGTPSYVVEGKVYQKTLPPELLRKILP